MIFHTKKSKNFRTSLCSAQFFLSVPPLTWNPGSAPVMGQTNAMKSHVNMINILYITAMDGNTSKWSIRDMQRWSV
jgi:hypothetical protein